MLFLQDRLFRSRASSFLFSCLLSVDWRLLSARFALCVSSSFSFGPMYGSVAGQSPNVRTGIYGFLKVLAGQQVLRNQCGGSVALPSSLTISDLDDPRSTLHARCPIHTTTSFNKTNINMSGGSEDPLQTVKSLYSIGLLVFSIVIITALQVTSQTKVRGGCISKSMASDTRTKHTLSGNGTRMI